MDDISDPKLFGELKEAAESVMNISSLTEMFNVDNLELGKGNLPPGSVLSLASVVGMAMIAQYISMGGGQDEKPSRLSFRNPDRISERRLLVRKRKRRRRYPYYESELDFPHHSGHKKRYLYNHIPEPLVKDEAAIDDYNEDIDFYEDKNYE